VYIHSVSSDQAEVRLKFILPGSGRVDNLLKLSSWSVPFVFNGAVMRLESQRTTGLRLTL